MTNVHKESLAILCGTGDPPLEPPLTSDEPFPGLVLAAPGGFGRDADRPECWTPDRDAGEPFGHALGLARHRLESEDSLGVTAEVWTDHRSDGCLDEGEYRFEDGFGVETEGGHTWPLRWAFSVRIRDPATGRRS